MSRPAREYPSFDDRAWLQGREIVHKIILDLSGPSPCVAHVMGALEASRGALKGLSVRPTSEDRFELVLHAGALSSEDASDLVARLADHPRVRHAGIEHVLIR